MEQVRVTVRDTTFRNSDTGFSVVRTVYESSLNALSLVGVLPEVHAGEVLIASGEFVNHPRFGSQFSVSSLHIEPPSSKEAVYTLLASGFVPHIGPSRARKIVDLFGDQTLEVLDTQPQRLREVKGIAKKHIDRIITKWVEKKAIRALMLFLAHYDISPTFAGRIYAAYKDASIKTIQENPYCLISDIWGIGFKKADAIAQKIGFPHDSFRRIRAGIVHVCLEAQGEGHLFVDYSELVNQASELLAVPSDAVIFSLDDLLATRELVREDTRVYLKQSWYAEAAVANLISQRIAVSGLGVQTSALDSFLGNYSHLSGWVGDPLQVTAIKEAIQNTLFLLTGGPGTGKTTTLKVIVAYFLQQNCRIALAAPTGRAAQRMGGISSVKAQTIHRLLEFKPNGESFAFARNENNQLEADVIIVDEVSMIDIFLMRSLLCALSPSARLVLVGDPDQLPSVGPGAVLADILGTRSLAHVHLQKIFRQEHGSTIVGAAHAVSAGTVPIFSNAKSDNCFFLSRETPEECLSCIIDLVKTRLPSNYGLNPIADIQVLSPMHRGVVGTVNLNIMLQKELNTSVQTIARGEVVFACGDKVMQVRNNYEKNVFNGDIGFIESIQADTSLMVRFDEVCVEYDYGKLDQLIHAYCISIHKSQGCEFKAVIIPVTTQHYVMLKRNLMYTAMTRARTVCIFVGSKKALGIAVAAQDASARNTYLGQRILEELSKQSRN